MGQHNAPRPLQPPGMGQHNAAPAAPAGPPESAPRPSDGAPSDEQNVPSGLPPRSGAALTRPEADALPEGLEDPSTAPSGLPGRRPQQ
jgi:hypothetical protein